MIKLASFIDAIHDAVLKANDTLTDGNSGIIAKYFQRTPSEEKDDERYTAESITLKYPHPTEGGMEDRDVEVPLLTLAPLSCPTIDSVEFSSRFEMTIIDNSLTLDFSKDNKDSEKSKSNRSGQITIKISPQDIPEGLKTIIEGYERILKTQIG